MDVKEKSADALTPAEVIKYHIGGGVSDSGAARSKGKAELLEQVVKTLWPESSLTYAALSPVVLVLDALGGSMRDHRRADETTSAEEDYAEWLKYLRESIRTDNIAKNVNRWAL